MKLLKAGANASDIFIKQGYQLFDEFLMKIQMFDEFELSICIIHQTGFIKHSNFLIVHSFYNSKWQI